MSYFFLANNLHINFITFSTLPHAIADAKAISEGCRGYNKKLMARGEGLQRVHHRGHRVHRGKKFRHNNKRTY